ncbi:hypothetical protein FLL45_19745 [Aliikangiella marina]|uniref:Type IV pilin accessory protein n=1 Tax=Aliikangiella marina TaxID=1712262 RepID=A0A545T2E9_9GAMM|nr:hypothetical protein [Aliikangiella marina]TQV71391.1 hypothetical protein FLL45_19745 [Aliikangiella marina]
MKRLLIAKTKATTIHLLISVAVILVFLLLLKNLWYPGPLFKIENVWQGLQILIPVDAVLGPILTFIIFKPGKKSLKLDLSIIGGLQLAALLYGGLIIYQQRPVLFTFVVDRFETVLASDGVLENINQDRLIKQKAGPIYLTYALPAQNDQERQDFLFNGVQFKKLPERHYPLKDYMDQIAAKSLELERFNPKDANHPILEEFRKTYDAENTLLLKLQASTGETIVVAINKNTSQIINYLDIDPWEEYSSR